MAFSPDGTRVATGSGDRSARVFDAATGAELCRLDHERPGVRGGVQPGRRPGGHRQRRRGSARVFDAATGAELCRLDHDGPVSRGGVQPGWRPGGHRQRRWRQRAGVRRGDRRRAVPPGPRRRRCPRWRSARMAPGWPPAAADGSARVFDAATGAEMSRLDHDGPVSRGGVQPGRRPGGHRQRRWQRAGVRRGDRRRDDAAWTTAARCPRWRSARMAPGWPPAAAMAARGCSTRRPAPSCAAWTTTARCRAVAFSPDGTRVATGSGDGSARVFDAATGAEMCRLDHDGGVCAVAFSPDGARVATGSGDGSARVFDAATGAEMSRLDHDGPVSAVAFSPDGARVATGSGDGSARVFDAATGAEMSRLDHDGPCPRWRSARMAPGWPPAAATVGSARVFDAATGAEMMPPGPRRPGVRGGVQPGWRPGGHRQRRSAARGCSTRRPAPSYAAWTTSGFVSAVAFSPDGARVATGSGDGSARVFDAATGAELMPPGPRRPGERGGVQPGWRPGGHRQRRWQRAGVRRGDRRRDDPVWTTTARVRGGVQPGWRPGGHRQRTRGGSARVFDAATGAEICRLDHERLRVCGGVQPGWRPGGHRQQRSQRAGLVSPTTTS